MRSALLFFLLLVFSLSSSQVTSSNAREQIEPRLDTDNGLKIIKRWHELQSMKNTRYDVDKCYGWIGDRPQKGEYIAIGFSPNCKIILDDYITFPETFDRMNAHFERFSEESYHRRHRCSRNHLFILRLHRLDEGGSFSYHYARVRMNGNKMEVTFFALKDVLGEGRTFHPGSADYSHPSVKFFNADEFPISFHPFNVYSIDYEIYVWFKTKEGLRLFNYRATWDSTNTDNGYHIDIFKQFSIPNVFIPEDRVAYIVTSDVEVHYFFIKTKVDNEHMVYMLNHTDLINRDFTRISKFHLKVKVDVFPTSIVGKIIPYISLGVHKDAIRWNKQCRLKGKVFVYRNRTFKEKGEVYIHLPTVSDPPLALNVFNTHFRSSFPFVTDGRRMKKPNHGGLVIVIILAVVAALFARWVTLGYDVLPPTISRMIRMRLSVKHRFMFKSLSKRGNYAKFFLLLYRMEVFIWKNGKKSYEWMKRTMMFEGDNEEETRQLLAVNPQDQHSNRSTRESSTPNE